jgi:hypothetical protein
MVEPSNSATAEHVARNEAMFREAIERIERAAEELNLRGAGVLPFICECADPTCTEIVQLTPAQYTAVRAHPARFVTAPGHVRNSEGWGPVVEEHGTFTVVEKIGEAAAIAAELDTRAHGSP